MNFFCRIQWWKILVSFGKLQLVKWALKIRILEVEKVSADLDFWKYLTDTNFSKTLYQNPCPNRHSKANIFRFLLQPLVRKNLVQIYLVDLQTLPKIFHHWPTKLKIKRIPKKTDNCKIFPQTKAKETNFFHL